MEKWGKPGLDLSCIPYVYVIVVLLIKKYWKNLEEATNAKFDCVVLEWYRQFSSDFNVHYLYFVQYFNNLISCILCSFKLEKNNHVIRIFIKIQWPVSVFYPVNVLMASPVLVFYTVNVLIGQCSYSIPLMLLWPVLVFYSVTVIMTSVSILFCLCSDGKCLYSIALIIIIFFIQTGKKYVVLCS
ncbi:hypothetical protein KUTeg_022386 [Tegillarca granosa]|uniref:ATP synthase F0 subunit 6 n=1 Tax=Tegillarca granosa TaxID=220873 RepID=A0ABQ9EBB9_TEGGR|nr:hypothetical protein KUTeg_022386 [Tegillarca granosa]